MHLLAFVPVVPRAALELLGFVGLQEMWGDGDAEVPALPCAGWLALSVLEQGRGLLREG